MTRIAVTLNVPVRQDPEIGTGAPHDEAKWDLLRKVLYDRFDGLSLRGRQQGVWRSPKTGLPVEDESRVYEIDIDEERLEEFRAVVRRIGKTFVQQAMRVVIRGEVEYIEGRADDEPL